jgi:hypothetical protein
MLIEPLERRVLMNGTVLFIRGATRSGGFLNGGSAEVRDDQLADINNTSTAAGNHGWGTLAATLRDAGYTVAQITEPKGADSGDPVEGRPIRFETMDLSKYSAIVFGSNNARYPRASVDAIEAYVRNGGGAIFISDANFGSDWRDAPDRDQAFLSRFGLIVNQDNGTYALSRAGGDFATADHPILRGVDEFDGEGVSPFIVPDTPPAGVTITRLVGAKSNVRNNDGTDAGENFAGSLRPANANDASLVVAHSGRGRVVGFFDRNTFFNANGVGSELAKFDNRQLALNLFDFATDASPPVVENFSFAPGAPSELKLRFDDIVLGLGRSDFLLRDPFTAEAIPRRRWGWAITESGGKSELSIRIKGAQPAGLYQLQINAGRFRDDAQNVSASRIRYNFDHDPSVALAGATPMQARVKAPVTMETDTRSLDDIFSDDQVIV